MSGVELRETGGKLTLEGHASTFGNWYPVGHFEEKVNPGTWKRCVTDPNLNCVLLVNHEGLPLSRVKSPSGPLELAEDMRGLFVRATLDGRNPRTAELRSAAELGGLQMSVGMKVHEDNIIQRHSGFSYSREINQASVNEVSAVTFGANAATDIAVSARSGLSVDEERALRRGTIEHRPAFSGTWIRGEQTCERCGGSMEASCPNCEPDGTKGYEMPTATDGRSLSRALREPSPLLGGSGLDAYRERAGIPPRSPVLKSLAAIKARVRADEQRREEDATLARRQELLADYSHDLARARREREAIYRGRR